MSEPTIPRNDDDEDVEGHGGSKVRDVPEGAPRAADTVDDDDDVEGHGGSKVR